MSSLRLFGPFYLLVAAGAVLAIGALPAAWREGAQLGLFASAFAGAVGLFLMARARSKALRSAIAALAIGFLLRATLLAAALLFCHSHGESLLACACAFLAFFAFGQLLEIALVSFKLDRPAQETQA